MGHLPSLNVVALTVPRRNAARNEATEHETITLTTLPEHGQGLAGSGVTVAIEPVSSVQDGTESDGSDKLPQTAGAVPHAFPVRAERVAEYMDVAPV